MAIRAVRTYVPPIMNTYWNASLLIDVQSIVPGVIARMTRVMRKRVVYVVL